MKIMVMIGTTDVFYLLCAAALRGKNYTTNHEAIDYNHELNSAIVPA